MANIHPEIAAVAMLIVGFIAAFAQKHGVAISENEYAGLVGATGYVVQRACHRWLGVDAEEDSKRPSSDDQ
jgi:hypothetical protein